jgi:hypothetical protein
MSCLYERLNFERNGQASRWFTLKSGRQSSRPLQHSPGLPPGGGTLLRQARCGAQLRWLDKVPFRNQKFRTPVLTVCGGGDYIRLTNEGGTPLALLEFALSRPFVGKKSREPRERHSGARSRKG